jgi:hypothetical protein
VGWAKAVTENFVWVGTANVIALIAFALRIDFPIPDRYER